MKGIAAWVLSAGLGLAAVPPMPEWQPEDLKALKKGDLVPGLLLLTEDNAPQAPAPVLPEAAPGNAIPEPLPEVEEKFLDSYFGQRPQRFLVDPQDLLGSKAYQDREQFLEYHSEDSAIDLFVYLFDGKQEIPSEVREEEIVERHFSSGKPAVVVYYYLGAPGRSDIYVGPVISDAVSAADQRRALESSVKEALEKPDKFDQLEAFCVQLSIRIYWMEKAAGLIRETPVPPVVRHAAEEPEKGRVKHGEMAEMIHEVSRRWGAPAAVMAGAVLAVITGLALVRSRARHRFPVFDVPPRLGGAHAAGIGAVISFGSTARPPSSQKNEVPDYLGL